MEKKILLEKLKSIEEDGGYGVQELFDKKYEGACPCFSGSINVDGKPFDVWGRCWRTSENLQDLHYFGDKEIAEAVKRCLDAQEWYNPYTLIKSEKELT